MRLITILILLIYHTNCNSQTPTESISTSYEKYNDTITKGRFELGIGGGLDFIVFINNYINTNFYIIDHHTVKLSIENKVGLMYPWALIGYDYPSVKLHTRICKIWITSAIGREFLYIKSIEKEKEKEKEKEFFKTIDYRCDIGIKIFEAKQTSYEISIPLRIDNEIPMFITGINCSLLYKF